MLFEALGKLKHQIIISSVLMMILGLLLLIIPEQYDGILIHILGYAAILLGAVMVWDFIGGNNPVYRRTAADGSGNLCPGIR